MYSLAVARAASLNMLKSGVTSAAPSLPGVVLHISTSFPALADSVTLSLYSRAHSTTITTRQAKPQPHSEPRAGNRSSSSPGAQHGQQEPSRSHTAVQPPVSSYHACSTISQAVTKPSESAHELHPPGHLSTIARTAAALGACPVHARSLPARPKSSASGAHARKVWISFEHTRGACLCSRTHGPDKEQPQPGQPDLHQGGTKWAGPALLHARLTAAAPGFAAALTGPLLRCAVVASDRLSGALHSFHSNINYWCTFPSPAT